MYPPYYRSHPKPDNFIPLREDAGNECLPSLFDRTACVIPDKPAVCDHRRSMSYEELRRESERVAATINRILGDSRKPRNIALIFEATVESVVGIMGTLRGGDAICPISPIDPPGRIVNYLEDAGIELILSTREAFPGELRPILGSRRVIFVDESNEDVAHEIPDLQTDPDQLAAILYTSGSTGHPKGVTQTHRTLVNMVISKGNELGISKSDNIAGLARFTFGSYYLNVFGALLHGSTLHLYDFYYRGFEGLRDWLTERRITLFHCTPTTMRQFLNSLPEPAVIPALRLISLGGETVYPNDVYRINRLLPSLSSLCTTGASIETWFYASTFFSMPFPQGVDHIPMGYVNDGCRVDIRDDSGNRVRTGETGEISVKAATLSPGYWGRPDLDAFKFEMDGDKERSFRTGDLGYCSPDGLVYHKGRLDCQVKVRGIRVDLGEVESALHNHPAVKEAVVVGHSRDDGDTELVSYVSLRPGSEAGRGDLYTYLAARLSPHQIPTRTVFLDSFPLTRTHKIDRNALPDPDQIKPPRETEHAAPAGAIETRLCAIWADVLGQSDFGVTTSFLEIGGDSLKAMRIRARMIQEFNATVPLAAFFTAGTIESMAALVKQAQVAP